MIPDSDNPLLYSLDHRSPQAAEGNFRNDFSMRAFLASRQLYDIGRHANAIMALEYGLRHDPHELRLHMMLIVTLMSMGRMAEAESQLQKVLQLHPSTEAGQQIHSFISGWKQIPDRVGPLPFGPDGKTSLFTSSLFGADGQFGNQIFQYAFAKLYTEKYGMRLETNEWVGQGLFGHDDPPISRILPFILEMEYMRKDLFSLPPNELGISNRDSQGYFQFHSSIHQPHKEEFISLFRPVPSIEVGMRTFLRYIRQDAETLVAVHVRCGDAADQGRIAPVPRYLEWLKEIWPSLDKPVLFLASDDMDMAIRAFSDFHPLTSEKIRHPTADVSFYPDFYMLTQADYLAASNSTFSFAASMLNRNARACLRPEQVGAPLVIYDPWNANPTA